MKIILFITVIFLVSCENTDETEKIKSEIEEKISEIQQLKNEVADLEKQIKTKSEDSLRFKIPVNVKKLKFETFKHFFEASGVVEPVNDAFISPEINGQIEEIYVEEGSQVIKDQLLAKLNTNVTENTVKEIETSLELAKTVYKKQKQLWEKNIGSEIEYLKAKNNKESLENKLRTIKSQLEKAYIRSPIKGIVDEIFKKEGELAIPGIQLMQVINLEDLYINVDVAEVHLPSVHKGDTVILKFPTYMNESVKVPVFRVGNVIEPDNRTFTVQLKIKNNEGKYKPNMLAVVEINDYSTDSAFVVPSLIIKRDLTGKYLYIVEEKDGNYYAKKRYIETGKSHNELTTVIRGLKPGEQVIIDGFEQVSDGSEVYIKQKNVE